jgi:hypothetical protein
MLLYCNFLYKIIEIENFLIFFLYYYNEQTYKNQFVELKGSKTLANTSLILNLSCFHKSTRGFTYCTAAQFLRD